MVLRAAVELVARADRRGGRRGVRRRAARARSTCDGLVEKVLVPGAGRAGARVRRRGARDPRSSTGSSAASARARSTRGFRLGPDRVRQPVLALARHERRAEDDGHHHARAGRQRQPAGRQLRRADLGDRVARRRAIALGTYIGGWRIIRTMGSRIIKMDPAQGFAAQGAGAAVILAASHLGFPLSTTHVISGGDHGRRRREARCRPCAGASPATSSSRGCSRCPPPRSSARLVYGVSSALRHGRARARSSSRSALVALLIAVFVRRFAQQRVAAAR